MTRRDEPLQQLSDEQLMQSYRLGNSNAFEELHRRHAAKVYGYLTKKLGSSSRVDDVFQETFLKVHRFRSKYDVSLPFVPWLFTICRNTMLDEIRRQKVRVDQEGMFENALSEDQPAPIADGMQGEVALEHYLAALSDREKSILMLHLHDGFSFREVAIRLGLTPENVRKLSSRAIKKLKAIWK